MIQTRLEAKGIDLPIERLQQMLYAKLPAIWGIAPDEYDCYGRCYRGETDNGYMPMIYAGAGEYEEVFGNDAAAVQSFFGVSEKISIAEQGFNKADVHLVFFVNLQRVSDSTDRDDDAARRAVYNLLKLEQFGFTLKEQVTGIANVFAEYPGKLNTIQYRDMHPYHYFRYNMELVYQPNQCRVRPVNDVLGK
jgi:hypothetical protein